MLMLSTVYLKLFLRFEMYFPRQPHVRGLDGGRVFLQHRTQDAATNHLLQKNNNITFLAKTCIR
jgi:hypothetical protein